MRLKQKVAIVTGACGGIGRAIVEKYVAEGARVLAVDLDAAATEQLAAQYDGAVKGLVVDVTDYAQVEQMIDTAVEQFGTLDVVINNAGIGNAKMLLDHDPVEDFDVITRVNQKGVYHGILAAGRKFKAMGKPGVILNTSSIYGQMAAEMTYRCAMSLPSPRR